MTTLILPGRSHRLLGIYRGEAVIEKLALAYIDPQHLIVIEFTGEDPKMLPPYTLATGTMSMDIERGAAMATSGATLDELVAQVLQLAPVDKVRLIERVVSSLERDVMPRDPARLRSLYGALAHLGSAPSAEEIDEARREAWANFPRDDIAP